ncbi:hypothetical protein T05_13324 [Trichinella murrelli]|uniref:Uncharacterized protein n=1 Tax=Trichinella murrelli TaxID=144512 RepID=A0A0V0TQL5_9BILA|nr:hypothetical protein T05_13324 [Trichinella murrelli]KRX41301.1 hypothetical protein T05_13324 [Trichinella murrelli]
MVAVSTRLTECEIPLSQALSRNEAIFSLTLEVSQFSIVVDLVGFSLPTLCMCRSSSSSTMLLFETFAEGFFLLLMLFSDTIQLVQQTVVFAQQATTVHDRFQF